MDGVIRRRRVGAADASGSIGEGRNRLGCLGFRSCRRQDPEQRQGRQEARSALLHDVLCVEVRGSKAQCV